MKQRILYLIEGWTAHSLSAEEQTEFFELLDSGSWDEEFKSTLDDKWLNSDAMTVMEQETAQRVFKTITSIEGSPQNTRLVRMPRMRYRWIAAAVLLVGISGMLIWNTRSSKKPSTPAPQFAVDIKAPVMNRARLTLADGRTIDLDAARAGSLITQNGVVVRKQPGGELIYQTTEGVTSANSTNTLFNPRGSKVISVTLSDGTRVWLNSESTLSYPTAFKGASRDVEVNGEAYFEVAHDAARPFRVKKGSVSIQVLGTHFNVNAYDDETTLQITLLEGRVRIQSDQRNRTSVVLQPGEQAQMANSSTNHAPTITVNSAPDLEEVMAWKNGRFEFHAATIEKILKQVSRYYDAEIIYKDAVPGHFVVDIDKDVSVSQLLQMLELTKRVHFSIKGKTITVMK